MRNVTGICGKELTLLAADTGREQIVRFVCVTSLWVERRKQKVSAHLCKKVAAVCWNRENHFRKTLCVARATTLTRPWAVPALASAGAQLRSLGRPLNVTAQSRKVLTFWCINVKFGRKFKMAHFL